MQLVVTAGLLLHTSEALCFQLSDLPQAVEATGFIGKSLFELSGVFVSVSSCFCCGLRAVRSFGFCLWLGLRGSVFVCALACAW